MERRIQSVVVRHVIRIHLGVSVEDANLVDAEKHERAPNDVEQLRSDKKNPQEDGILQSFCCKGGP